VTIGYHPTLAAVDDAVHEEQDVARLHVNAHLGLNPIVTLEKQLPNMRGKLV
jgi:hypothetical protein